LINGKNFILKLKIIIMKRLSYEELINDLIKKLDNIKNRYLIALADPLLRGKLLFLKDTKI
jgi:hypothetical protein